MNYIYMVCCVDKVTGHFVGVGTAFYSEEDAKRDCATMNEIAEERKVNDKLSYVVQRVIVM